MATTTLTGSTFDWTWTRSGPRFAAAKATSA